MRLLLEGSHIVPFRGMTYSEHLSFLTGLSTCKLLVKSKTSIWAHNVCVVARALRTSSPASHPHCRAHQDHITEHCSLKINIAVSSQYIEASSRTWQPRRRASQPQRSHRPRNDRWAGCWLVSSILSPELKGWSTETSPPF